MIELKELRKAFGSLQAVDGVSLSIQEGSCFGLLGPNGAGKSTTISMLVGGLIPDSGSVMIDGVSVHDRRSGVLSRIGYAPQELALYEDLTAEQNLQFFASLYPIPTTEVGNRIDSCLELGGLNDRRKSLVKEYSGGMKRRLNIVAALLHDPDLIVLDEPTVGVDAQSRNAIFDMLETLKADGKTLIYTSHYMEEVERLCDRIAIMDHGVVVAEGTLDQLIGSIPDGNTVQLTFTEFHQAEQAEHALAELKPVRDGIALTIRTSDLSRAVIRVVQGLDGAGIPLADLKTARANLEQVFLAKTGRSLRD